MRSSDLSNYPPGVTGNEYAIGGAQREWTEVRECPHCGWEGEMEHEAHYEFGTMAWCGNPDLVEVVSTRHVETGEVIYGTAPCPLTKEGFIVDLDGPDPDEMYDRMKEDV